MNWQSNKYFKEKFITIGFGFSKISKVPHVKVVSADTETKLYYNNKVLTDDEAYKLYRDNGQAFIKSNVEVRAYAFTLAFENCFALFQCAEDFITACCLLNVDMVFWYNAKFDFAIFDYYFLTHEWKEADELTKGKEKIQKLPSKTYQSLNGDFGQRYQMTIWFEYINNTRHKAVHKFKMLDICNIYGGGLAKNLEDFKITDKNGNDIRKLKMKYDEGNANTENDLQYMIADTVGLYYLAVKIDKVIFDISGLSLFKGDYITAGGLAKKCLLKEMFKADTPKQNINLFKRLFPLTINEDKKYRDNGLYKGGKCLVNPYKKGIELHNIYKYDVNSMYPDKMRNMAYPVGKPKFFRKLNVKPNKLYILKIEHLRGNLRKDMIAVYQDNLTGDYVENILVDEQIYIWFEELQELDKWYNLSYNIISVLEFNARFSVGAKTYVDKFYKIKSNSKGAIKQGAKLFLNSAYGKLAQRVEREICKYELNEEGVVHLVHKGTETDEKSMLSVVVGSRITALARVDLLQKIRDVSQGNPRKNFVYCDTDSIHSLTPYENTDAKALGMLKNEGVYSHAVYLAPKSYLMFDEQTKHYEVHCKGVNTKVVENELLCAKNFNEAMEIFRPNKNFKCLCGLNVKGGKALIYVDKMILNDVNFAEEIAKYQDLEKYDYEGNEYLN